MSYGVFAAQTHIASPEGDISRRAMRGFFHQSYESVAAFQMSVPSFLYAP